MNDHGQRHTRSHLESEEPHGYTLSEQRKGTRSRPTRDCRNPSVHQASQPRVHRLALQRQDAEDAFVYASQGLSSNETFQALGAECELAQSERSLLPQTARSKPGKI